MTAAAEATWDGLAAAYARQERWELHALGRMLDRAGPAERWVDLATGTGLVLRELARRDDRPAHAIGIDRSARMLAQVGALPQGWETMKADAAEVPLDDASADVVSCAYLLHLLDPAERAAVLAEARRLLRPGGRLLTITVWSPRVLVARAHELAARRERWAGLAPLDPTGDVERAGFAVERRVHAPRRGYPSLILSSRCAATSR